MRSLLNVSAIFSRANRPRRLTQTPRLVETVTSGEAVTTRSAMALCARPSSLSSAPKPACGGITGRCLTRKAPRTPLRPARGRAGAGRERHPLEKSLQLGWRDREPFELVPFMPRPDVHRGAQAFRLRRRHQAGVVVLVAGKRQGETLDGVADEADRAVVIDL